MEDLNGYFHIGSQGVNTLNNFTDIPGLRVSWLGYEAPPIINYVLNYKGEDDENTYFEVTLAHTCFTQS